MSAQWGCPALCDPWTAARRAHLSMEFSSKNTGVSCPFPPQSLPHPGIGANLLSVSCTGRQSRDPLPNVAQHPGALGPGGSSWETLRAPLNSDAQNTSAALGGLANSVLMLSLRSGTEMWGKVLSLRVTGRVLGDKAL